MADGFLGFRTSFMLDFVVCALAAIVPVLLYSIYLVKFKGKYVAHRNLQLGLAVVLLIAVGAFEVDMQMIQGGWQNVVAKREVTLNAEQLQSVRYVLWIHLVFAVTSPILWAVFEERLQTALTGFGLVRRVRSVVLAASGDCINGRRDEVIVNSAAEETRTVRRSNVSRGQLTNQLFEFQLGQLRRNVERPFELERLRNLVEQSFDRINADRFEHFPLLVGRVEEVAQQNLRKWHLSAMSRSKCGRQVGCVCKTARGNQFRSHPWREVVASATGSASATKAGSSRLSQHWQSQWHTK